MTQGGQFIGLREANKALKRLPEFAKEHAQEAMNMTAFRVTQGAEKRASRRTGRLKLNITWKARPRSVSAVVGVEAPAFYWKFLEYGTVHMRERPFIRPAAEAERDPHHQRLLKALEKAADRVEQTAGSATSSLL